VSHPRGQARPPPPPAVAHSINEAIQEEPSQSVLFLNSACCVCAGVCRAPQQPLASLYWLLPEVKRSSAYTFEMAFGLSWIERDRDERTRSLRFIRAS
jgi:hypothetical protein